MTELPPRRRSNWVNLGLTAALAVVVCLSLAQAGRRANIRADLRIARKQAAAIQRAFQAYYERHGAYPNSHVAPRIEEETLHPLRRRGYYTGQINGLLLDQRIDAYHSPDDQGLNQEFWVEMTLARDPSIRILVARSDDAPLSGGEWKDGVFVYRDGRLE